MSSPEQAPGVIPLVFESGVVNIDKEGVLHVHLTHSPDAPHPMVTHPDGEETTIPGSAKEVCLSGGDRTNIRVRCSMHETDVLPQGFVFRIEGWDRLQLEMSGDLTVVLAGLHEPPLWFQPGKVHRFDGPDDGVRIHVDSQPLESPRIPRPSTPTPRPSPAASSGPAASPGPAASGTSGTSGSSGSSSASEGGRGCGGLLLMLLMLGCALSSVSVML